MLRGKKISIIGLGETGIASAEVLGPLNDVTVFDRLEVPIPPRLENIPLKFRLGDPLYEGAEEADLIIISPGVPSTEPFIERALKKNVPILSEIEIAFQFCPAPIVAVTGTDGKSTTVSLIAHILNTADKKAITAGNIGTPFIKVVPSLTPQDIVVLEVSSFQLEWIKGFHPRIGILLNIAEDHLERYPSILEYGRTKMKLFQNQTEDDFAILNADDPLVCELSRTLNSHRLYFSLTSISGEGAIAKDDRIYLRIKGQEVDFDIPPIHLIGSHNLQNILASSISAFLLDVSIDKIVEGLSSFQPLEHRVEKVGCINGVLFINDSKATNPHAASKALASFPPPIILIAGGRLKEGADYEKLFREWGTKLKALVLIGESAPLLEKIARNAGIDEIHIGKDLEEAVAKAFNLSSPGDTVLFSPACSSFDMFKNFEERGKHFKEAVQLLGEGKL